MAVKITPIAIAYPKVHNICVLCVYGKSRCMHDCMNVKAPLMEENSECPQNV